MYDALYKMNVSCDFLDASHNDHFGQYKLLVVPALYAAPDSVLVRLNAFVKNGGHIIYTFKSALYDDQCRYRIDTQDAVKKAGLSGPDQQIQFPLIIKSGINQNNKLIHYYFNYSAGAGTFNYPYKDGKELISGKMINKNESLQLEPWV